MPSQKYTLVGYSSDPQTNESEFVFVHVHAATSPEDARQQWSRSVLPRDATLNVFVGHLQPMDRLPALQLTRAGRLEAAPAPYSPVSGDLIEVSSKDERIRYQGRVSAVKADGSFFLNGPGFGHQFHASSAELFDFTLLERRAAAAPARRMRP
ncbi:hypothetical protein [Methylibium petroleiphilum]|uniref:Uncharacterized protein n=1 Tax=Methylibium petroleiphilum (strain ATCC BAA-1232 / LMG 22953 / PM1) TaxID=420662 RepID=A2SP99_METPP|nr:hypothetical protein [Methylibium petroleiphilum]ABM97388.1 hypothetical protein Mpe_B0624 [Methylibium petroleiphilum PM1]